LEIKMMERKNISTGTKWENIVGYSRAVRLGPFVFVSGTTAVDESGNLVGPGDPYAQASFIFKKIEKALTEVGASLQDVVRTRMFLINVADWEAVCKAHSEALREVRPAATLVEVSALITPEMLVEIEVDAVVGE
jgi:enamine deaminase RidA (YjgF/YER057c/UK114 family)